MQARQGGGGQILLAYGLNKNLKQLDMANKNRAKSARPRRGGGGRHDNNFWLNAVIVTSSI